MLCESGVLAIFGNGKYSPLGRRKANKDLHDLFAGIVRKKLTNEIRKKRLKDDTSIATRILYIVFKPKSMLKCNGTLTLK